MEPSPGTVDLASLAPPLRALVEGQQTTVEALRAEVVSLTDRNRNLEHRHRRLEHLVRALRRAIYGKKSEKLHPDQLLLAFEELEGALAEAEADAPASTTPTPRAKRPSAQRNIGHLPAHLIEGALPTEGMIAHVLVSKFADHLPLYRQAQIYVRSGIELHRSTLADWVGKASFHLRPVFERLKAALKRSNTLGRDETTVRVLDPGRGKTKTGDLWTMARDERGWSGPDPPRCVYEYVPSRSGKHGETLLEGFQGTVQVDGYPGHNRRRREGRPGGALTLAACWIHARRGLKEMCDSNGSPIAQAGLKRIAQLYKIEANIRGASPATRQCVRWTESAPRVNACGSTRSARGCRRARAWARS